MDTSSDTERRVHTVMRIASAIQAPVPRLTWTLASRPLATLPQNPSCLLATTSTVDVIRDITATACCIRVALEVQSEMLKDASNFPATASTADAAFPYFVALRFGPTLGIAEPPVRVSASEIHGRGVFATRDIKQNELVTSYPVHALQICMDKIGGPHCFSCWYRDATLKDDYAASNWERYKMYGRRGFAADRGIAFFGDPSVHSPSECGHMVNDPINTGRRANCFPCPLVGGVVTAILMSLPVKKGEELLLSYGPDYWDGK